MKFKISLLLPVLAALLLIGSANAETATTATSPLRLVLSKDMPEEKLTYSFDARGFNVIYIIHEGWGGAIFDIHFFEDLVVPAHDWPNLHFFNNRRINPVTMTLTPQGNGYSFHLSEHELVSYELNGSINVQGNRVILEGWIKNQDNLAWGEDGIGLMCFRSRLCPEFRDVNGERTFVTRKDTGQRINVFSLAGVTDKYFNFYLPENPYRPCLVKTNATGTREISIESDPCRSLLGNRSDETSCLHANVALKANPGETVKFKTTLEFREITTQTAVSGWRSY